MDNLMEAHNAMEVAKDELKSSKILFDAGQYRSSVSSSYYGIFSTTKALLFLKDIQTKTHVGLIKKFNEEYYNTGDFSNELYKCLTRSETLRKDADYDFCC